MLSAEIEEPQTQMPTVHVVDDDAFARESVRVLIDPMGVPTQLFASSEEFLEAYDPAAPGCLVVDLRMPRMTGIELLRELKTRGLAIPTIVLTGYADVPATVQSMKLGAVTLLEKPCRDDELYNAIQEALELDSSRRREQELRDSIESRLESLTVGERQVLDMMVEGVPNKVVASRLDVSLRTVEARRHKVLKKMEVQSVAELVQVVMIAQLVPRLAAAADASRETPEAGTESGSDASS